MIGRSHIVLGVACAVTAAAAGWVPLSFASISAAAVGSLTPDLDTERSTLGCRVPWFSKALSRMVGHRTITHSLAIPLLMAWGLVHFMGLAALHSPWGSFLIGYVSHIVADLMTGGCWALYPLSRGRISIWPYAKVGSFREYVLLVGCLGLLGCVTYHYLSHSQDLSHLGGKSSFPSSSRAHHAAFIA